MTMSVIDTPVLRAHDLGTRFFGREAVRGFSIELHAGAVHGLYGTPGAGKTTIVRLLTGALLPHEGELAVSGRIVASGGGALLPGRSVAANLFLGREPRTAGVIDQKRMAEDAAAFLCELRMPELDPGIRANVLDADALLSLECACAVAWGASLLVIDDARAAPTAAVRRAAAAGVAVLQLSDDLVGLLENCDSVTVL